MKTSNTAVSVGLVAAVAIIICACSESDTIDEAARSGGKLYAVTVESTPFYRYGPQQASGPDKRLPKDTLMTLVRGSFGYWKVRLPTGEQGFVAREDIHPAAPALVAAATHKPSAATATVRFDPNDPRFAPPPATDPDVEPTPIPSPPNF